MPESDIKDKRYIKVESMDLSHPMAVKFCEYLEKIINEEFMKRMRKSMGYEKDRSDEDNKEASEN